MHTQGYCHVNVKTEEKSSNCQQAPGGRQAHKILPHALQEEPTVNASISDIQPQDWTMFKSLILRYLARPKSLKSGRLLTPGR